MSVVFRGNFDVFKVGTATTNRDATEIVSMMRTIDTNTAVESFNFCTHNTLATATSATQSSFFLEFRRTIVTSVTDTNNFQAAAILNKFVVPAGQTYTNSNSTGVSGMVMFPLQAIDGTYAITRYNKLRFVNDAVVSGTRKIAISFGTLSGATNNAQIADNIVFTGDYFINSSTTNPSAFGGQVRVASLGVANSAAGSTPGTCVKKIEVFDASGASLGFVPVYDAIT